MVELRVPALRDRREDTLPLARLLIEAAATRMKRIVVGLSPAAEARLLHYEWPGNVRELENAMERAVALAAGPRVELEDLPAQLASVVSKPLTASGAVQSLRSLEKQHILSVLAINDGNQTQTALQLGIGPATLYRKLKLFRLGDLGRLARPFDDALLAAE